MVQAGSPAISEDGKSVMRTDLYREAMKIAAECKIPVLAHCEDIHLVQGGVVNADEYVRKQGLAGITNSVEDDHSEQRYYFSKRDRGKTASVPLLHKGQCYHGKKGKRRRTSCDGEVCPHHFTLTSEDITR